MKKILFSLFCLSMISACQKESVVPQDQIPQPPAEDRANNVCVFAKYYGTNKRPASCDDDPTLFNPKNNTTLSDAAVIALENTGGYKVLDVGVTLYSKLGCWDLDNTRDTYGAALAWVKYDCRKTDITIKVLGPYTNSALPALKASYTSQFESDGYHIEHVSTEYQYNTGYYLNFYLSK